MRGTATSHCSGTRPPGRALITIRLGGCCITEVDGAGKALSATNTVPIANTSTIVRDLTPGATYKFAIESYSTAYDGGKSAAIVYTVPTLLWEPVAGASSYVVSSYDAYSGRTLGVQYRTNQNSLTIYGLPMGTAVELVVQGVGGGYYSEAASTVVEIPYDQSYYYNGFSPYWGYNPALPYWYSSYYPIGWYNVWYPGKWAIYGIADALNPFNDFYGPGWWYNRPYPISPLWPLRPGVRPPVWSGGWGSWGGSGLINNRPRPVPLPGQRPPLTARPAPLPDIVRPSTRPAPGIATTRPAPGVPTTRPTTPTTRPAPGVPTTRPAPGVVDAGGRPTTRPATPDLRPAPGSVGNGLPTTRPAPGVPTTRPAPGGFPTTQPYVPTTRPAVPQMPTTRPAVPQMPMTRPAPQVPMARPAVPQMPMTRPAMPQPQMPMAPPLPETPPAPRAAPLALM
ncbi:MAG: hypothetical protein J3K34DRAFT_214398 [Monoraphidium minutum]|nr:MAG: hypothetical protein J3K34DRAFT_214398 [Monoraphidium minutum]